MIQPLASITQPLATSTGVDSSSPSTSAATTTGTNGLLDPNQFLTLLVDSLKYQNPLNPTSSAQFLSQLAALSQVQTQQQISSTDQTTAAANMIGKTVSGSDPAGLPISGVVTGFSLTTTGPVLNIGNDSVSLGLITSVATTPVSATPASSGGSSQGSSSTTSASSTATTTGTAA